MKILLTGASSFTGMWFASQLSEGGHEVTATFSRSLESYEGIRLARIRKVMEVDCRAIFDCPFGQERFLKVIEEQDGWDLLCHHAAWVADFRSPDFDPIGALTKNTWRLPQVCKQW